MRWILEHPGLGLIDLESPDSRILQISDAAFYNNFGIDSSSVENCSIEGFCDINVDDPNYDDDCDCEKGIHEEVSSKSLRDALNNGLIK